MSDQAQANKDVILRHFNEAIGQHNFAVWDEIMHPDYLLHHPMVPPGRDGYRATSEMFWAAFTSPTYEIHHMIAEGDLVLAHYTERATQIAPLFGVDAGGSYEKPGLALYRLEDGKMREAWIREDDHSFMTQLGITSMAV